MILEGVTEIGRGAFAYCHSLTGVVILEGVTEIGYDAFMGCHNLASVAIPESAVAIDMQYNDDLIVHTPARSYAEWYFTECGLHPAEPIPD